MSPRVVMLALWTLNPAIRVQVSVLPLFQLFAISKVLIAFASHLWSHGVMVALWPLNPAIRVQISVEPY